MKFLILLSAVFVLVQTDNGTYEQRREQLINADESLSVGSKLQLNANENKLNNILMDAKRAELQIGFDDPAKFAPANHYFLAKTAIEKSKVFSIIKPLPKGGALHIHDASWCSVDYIVKNITYRDHLYVCIENGTYTQFVFQDPAPNGSCWYSVKTLRQENGTDAFDATLYKALSLVTDNPYKVYPDINTVWTVFQNLYDLTETLIFYRPAFLDYYYEALQQFYDDNVKYIELRTSFPDLYELDGSIYNASQVLEMLLSVVTKFKSDHEDFLGVNFIYAKSRHVNQAKVALDLGILKQLQQIYYDYIIGFDLVGQEDLGYPLIDFISELRSVKNETHFFFHAGETDWNGMSTDLNLFDAVLLNCKRIGHGFALTKHPVLMERVKAQGICVELNPISNQVLMLVQDQRNHPGAVLISEGFEVVVSSDDPGMWGATGLSYDWYVTFLGLSSSEADLRFLKQLAMNSLIHSGMTNAERNSSLIRWHNDWDHFVNTTLALYS